MDNRESYEQEIDLKDMMFYILYRWRPMLAVIAIASLLAGGYTTVYNGYLLPGKRTEVQSRLDALAAVEEGQAPDAEQIQKLEKQLEELTRLGFVKYLAMGLAGGCFGVFFCYGMAYVLGDRMQGERELLERYGYRLLGVFPRRRGGKPLEGFDGFLEMREGVSGQITEGEAYRIVAVNITNLAKDGGTFLVTGTAEDGKLQEFAKALGALLQENVILVTGGNMNRTASTLEALGKCDAVILVEERGVSARGKIQREHESITAFGKPVVGYVVL